ncbi:hypothetical protein BD410DRAFT_258510 [Rickenella mellea]|uniref:Uncharacterized protein n=1 Tax=Rickenella mellea TaxID=50990 RepID=A0A4Y7Q501_9AGAM|nr:hypothetical protein BD410DRAFT_258510 [Rickenella mellea]
MQFADFVSQNLVTIFVKPTKYQGMKTEMCILHSGCRGNYVGLNVSTTMRLLGRTKSRLL